MAQNSNIVQSSFISGVLASEAMGRIDLAKYYNGVKQAVNMYVEPQGGMKKRDGFEFLLNLYQDYRMLDFIFNTQEKYVVFIGSYDMKVWYVDESNHELVQVKPVNNGRFYSGNQIKELDYVQSADTMIFTHKDVAPQRLVRDRSKSPVEWRLEAIPLRNIPMYNWDPLINKHEIDASRKQKAIDEQGEGQILKLRDIITNAIKVSDAMNPRVELKETETTNLNLGTYSKKLVTTVWRNQFVDPSDSEWKWGTRTTIEETYDGAPPYYPGVPAPTDSTEVTHIFDKPIADVVQEALRTQITLKDQDYNLLDKSQLEALMGGDFSEEIDQALSEVLGEFETADEDNLIDRVWGTGKNRVFHGYPSYCAFYQNRLILAGTIDKPMSIWSSVVNDFFNFDITEPDNDYAIADTLNSKQLNAITGLHSGAYLQVYTTGSEWINTATPMTQATSAFTFQTGMGSEPNVPLDSLDGSTLFIDKSSSVREFIYNFDNASYVSKDISLLASQIVRQPKQIAIVRSANVNISKLVYFLNSDGTLAVLNIDSHENIMAWTIWETDGEILEICAVDKSLFILVRRGSVISFEVLGRRENIYLNSFQGESIFLDSYQLTRGSGYDEKADKTVGGGFGVLYQLSEAWDNIATIFKSNIIAGMVVIDDLDRFNGKEVDVLLDDMYQGKFFVNNGKIEVPREFSWAKIGLAYSGLIETLPLTSQSAIKQFELKRIVKIVANFNESRAITLDEQYINDGNFAFRMDSKPELLTGIKEVYTLGWDKMKTFEIESKYPYNFHILSLNSVIDSNKLV